MLRRSALVAMILLAAGCGQSGGNPFGSSSPSKPPAASAALVFVSGSWAADLGQPRELMAIAADGSGLQQLTSCARESTPCDILQVAPSPDRNRMIVVRTTPDAEAGANVLYFMDLTRSVQQILLPKRRVESADWSADGSFLLYSSASGQAGDEDLFTAGPDGTNEQNLTDSLTIRERFARIDPSARTAAYEHLDTDGVSHVYVFRETPITSGPATGTGAAGHTLRRRIGCHAGLLPRRDPARLPAPDRHRKRRARDLGPDGDRADGRRHAAHARQRAALPRRPGLEHPRHRVRRDRRGRGHVAAGPDPAGRQRADGAANRAGRVSDGGAALASLTDDGQRTTDNGKRETANGLA